MAKKTMAQLKAEAAAKDAGGTQHALPPPPVTPPSDEVIAAADDNATDKPAEENGYTSEAELDTDPKTKAPPLLDAAGVSHEELVANEEARMKAGALPTTAGPAEVRKNDPNKQDPEAGGNEDDATDRTTSAEGKTKDASDLAAENEMLRETIRNQTAELEHLKGTRSGGTFEGGRGKAAGNRPTTVGKAAGNRPTTVGKTMKGVMPARTEDIPTVDEINSGVSS